MIWFILIHIGKMLLLLLGMSLASFAFLSGLGIARHFRQNGAFEYPSLISVEKRGTLSWWKRRNG